MTDTRRIQDQPLDQSTEGTPQQFDDDGYVVGHPHHEHVTSDDLSPDGHLIGEAATDGEPAEPEGEVLDDDEASIAPPPGSPDPGPEAPGGPDLTPPEPGVPTPPEPAPFAPEEADEHGGQPHPLGDRVL